MFDFQVSNQPHFDNACRAFAVRHNLSKLARTIGMKEQTLRNKLNPDQVHHLTAIEIAVITDATEDATLIDGLLAQMKCMPAVPVNELAEGNIATYTLHATAALGSVAASAASPERQTRQVKNAIMESVNAGIRHLSLIGLAIQGRVEGSPVLASAVGAVASVATNGMV
ncbi:regulatory protein CII bacteriophage 186 [Rahnella aceris]|uniref:Regulatory protein CII bacteriophage 186 n=1 Tax=Rahnella sp. (strain Y9602) TaxID=2703885 RepID=A0A0H3F8C2_RAHSY|nr:phage regulatory CII family protein [Rahnella aceris]ADW72194.1 regulatory protein CII bacteriophage 186 [Rahnella aceris]